MSIEFLKQQSPEIPEVVNWLNDQIHMRFSSQRGILHTIDSQRQYIKSMELHGNAIFLVRHDDVACGTFSLIIHKQVRVCEIGLLVAPKLQGKGIGRKIFKEACNIATSEFKARKIRAGCVEQNDAMLKIFMENNLEFEARLVQEGLVDGKYQDLLLYSKFV